jgi:DNA replication and repair protein RecF
MPSYAPQEQKLRLIADAFSEQLQTYQAREVLHGVSLLGPHRDDLVFRVEDRDMNLYGSRGQQRTIVLSLKLAETQFMRMQTGEEPILLLDDVLSELDPIRRAYVLDTVIGGRQVVITSSAEDALDVDFLSKANVLRVENGTIRCSV